MAFQDAYSLIVWFLIWVVICWSVVLIIVIRAN